MAEKKDYLNDVVEHIDIKKHNVVHYHIVNYFL